MSMVGRRNLEMANSSTSSFLGYSITISLLKLISSLLKVGLPFSSEVLASLSSFGKSAPQQLHFHFCCVSAPLSLSSYFLFSSSSLSLSPAHPHPGTPRPQQQLIRFPSFVFPLFAPKTGFGQTDCLCNSCSSFLPWHGRRLFSSVWYFAWKKYDHDQLINMFSRSFR